MFACSQEHLTDTYLHWSDECFNNDLWFSIANHGKYIRHLTNLTLTTCMFHYRMLIMRQNSIVWSCIVFC